MARATLKKSETTPKISKGSGRFSRSAYPSTKCAFNCRSLLAGYFSYLDQRGNRLQAGSYTSETTDMPGFATIFEIN